MENGGSHILNTLYVISSITYKSDLHFCRDLGVGVGSYYVRKKKGDWEGLITKRLLYFVS